MPVLILAIGWCCTGFANLEIPSIKMLTNHDRIAYFTIIGRHSLPFNFVDVFMPFWEASYPMFTDLLRLFKAFLGVILAVD